MGDGGGRIGRVGATILLSIASVGLLPGVAGASAPPPASPASTAAPATTCPSSDPCAAPWMAYLTNALVARAPLPSDYATVAATDDPPLATRRQVAKALRTSMEARGFTVELEYSRCLGRSPDPSGGDFWTRALADGRRNPEQLTGAMLGSHEFSDRFDDWIDEMYQRVLARGADPSGHQYWAAKAQSHSQERVARMFLASAAARRERARLIYASLLAGIRDSGPTAAEVDHGADLLRRFTGEDELIVEIVSTDEVYLATQADA